MLRKANKSIPVLYVTVLAFVVFGATLRSAAGQVGVYTNQSAFDTVLSNSGSGTETITFEGIAPSGGFQNVSNPFTIGGVTFTGDSNAFININDSQLFGGSGYNYGTGATMGFYENANGNIQDGANGAFTATLPSGENAVGLDVGDFGGDPVTISLSNGESVTLDAGTPFPGPGFNFIGFITPTDITSFTVTPTANTFGSAYDNVTFSNVTVPEPSGGLLAAIGLFLLASMIGISYWRNRTARV